MGSMMANLHSIEQAVQVLSPVELAEFRRWFIAFDAAHWDAQIEQDASSGKLEMMANEALAEYQANRTKPL
jgi:hypothetical protein